MKRLAILAILAAFILGTVATASAVDIKARGSWRVHANWLDNTDFQKGEDDNISEDDFAVWQRARVWFDFVANENLKAVLGLEIGDSAWGNTGADLGSDETAVIEVKHAYLDFNLPDTEVNIKAGVQWVELPSSFGSNIIGGDMGAFVVSVPFNDMISMTAGWARPVDLNQGDDNTEKNATLTDNKNDEIDVFFLALPINTDDITITPFYATALAGQYALNNLAATDAYNTNVATQDDATLWWAGVNVKVDMLDPIVILSDLNYGRANYEEDALDSAGWYFDLALDYKMDMMTPEVFFVYSTGDDDDAADGSEMMPTLYTEAYAPTSFGFMGSSFGKTDSVIANNVDANAGVGLGLWALGFKLKSMTFMEGLSHDFIVMYAKGTNDKKNIAEFTEKDSLWEVDFNTKYQMYENLAAIVELGYINLNLSDDELAGRGDDLSAAWKLAVGFKYDF